MKTSIKTKLLTTLLAFFIISITACEKENSGSDDITDVEAATIAVAGSETSGIEGTSEDSVYIMHECAEKDNRTEVAEATLAASITTYLDAHYSGYKFFKAFSIFGKNDASLKKGYIVIIYYNNKPVAIKFNADGSFKKVLEQREKKDVRGKGWHLGGRFQHRNGMLKDTVAITALPVNVLAYFTATYSTDTLAKAFRLHDGGYLLLSYNNGIYATAFKASGNFHSRVKLHIRGGKATVLEAAALPAKVIAYLQATYPGYVFNRAFSLSVNESLRGYIVIIDANNTRYGIAFDANGDFEAAKAIR